MTPDFMTVGDYARQLVQRRQNADVRDRMDTLLAETGSGRKADLASALRGDFTRLAAFEGDLADLAAYQTAGSELRTRLEAADRALGAVQDETESFAADLLGAPPGQDVGRDTLVKDARGRFATVVWALNAEVAGRSVLSGTATETPALASAEAMLATVEGIAAGEATAADAEAAIRAWFAPGGGFDAAGYLGDATPVPDQPVGPGVALGLSVTAEAAPLRDVLASLAVAALSGTGPMAGNPEAQRQRLVNAGAALLNAQTGVTELRGGIGATAARLEEVGTRNAAETAAIESSRARLTDVDIYDKATELEAVQSQLELLYAITARSARLTLVDAL